MLSLDPATKHDLAAVFATRINGYRKARDIAVNAIPAQNVRLIAEVKRIYEVRAVSILAVAADLGIFNTVAALVNPSCLAELVLVDFINRAMQSGNRTVQCAQCRHDAAANYPGCLCACHPIYKQLEVIYNG